MSIIQSIADSTAEMSRMNSKRQVFYHTILVFVVLLLINISHVNSFPSDPPTEDYHWIGFQSILDERASLINQLDDRQSQLNNLVEEYGSSLTGREENVLNLVKEVKELWAKLQEMTNKRYAAFPECYSCSEEQEQEARRQDETISNLRDGVFATLFNAKDRKCKSEKEAFYEPQSKCFEIGKSCPDDRPNQLLYEFVGTNEGVCDCSHEIGLVFHDQTGECYLLNTQGPCKTGEWLIYNSSLGIEDALTCEPVPDKECKLDGSQVFFRDQCETLGYNSAACGDAGILIRDSDDLGIIRCTLIEWSINFGLSSIAQSIPPFSCPQGFRRALNNRCRPILQHGIRQKRNIF